MSYLVIMTTESSSLRHELRMLLQHTENPVLIDMIAWVTHMSSHHSGRTWDAGLVDSIQRRAKPVTAHGSDIFWCNLDRPATGHIRGGTHSSSPGIIGWADKVSLQRHHSAHEM